MLTKISKGGKQSGADLVTLLTECHDRIRHFVSLAGEAASRSDVPEQERVEACQQVERYFSEALPLHVADEEQSILPRLRERCSSELNAVLEAMQDQHTAHGPKLSGLLRASAAVRGAPGNAELRAALAQAASELEREFAEHLRLEESSLFPAIRSYLPAEVQELIVGELRQRRSARTQSGETP